MDTLQPLEEIDLSFLAQQSSSSTFVTSQNNVMTIPEHIQSTDSPKENETEPLDEFRQQFVAVVVPIKHSSSKDDNTIQAEEAEPMIVPMLKVDEEQQKEEDEYMESENEEDTGLASSRPGYRFPSSTNTVAKLKPYNARVEGQKSRAYFSDKHNAMLENIYTTNQYPNKDLKAELAEKIKITEVQVANWFSRRRKRAADEALEKKKHQEMLERLGGPNLATSAQTPSHPTPVSISTATLTSNATSSPSPSVESPGTPTTLTNGALKRPRAESEQDPRQPPKLRSMELSKKLSFLLRGGGIVNPNDIDAINGLMEQTGNDDGKKYILNALLSTKSPAVQERYCKLGKSVRLLAADNEIDPDIKREASELENQWRQLVEVRATTPLGAASSSSNDKRTNRTIKNGRNDVVEASSQILPKFKKGARITPLNVDSTVKVEAPLETPPKASPKITENAGFFKELIGRPLSSSSSSSPSPAKRLRATSPVRAETKSPLVQVQKKESSNMTPPVSPTTVPMVASIQRSSPPLPSPTLSSSLPTTFVPVSVSVPAPSNTPAPAPAPTRALSPPIVVDSTLTCSDDMPMEDIQPVPAYIQSTTTNGLKRSALRKPTDGTGTKKVVRFRSDKELVAIRLIEPRSMPQFRDGIEEEFMDGDEAKKERPQFFFSQKEREELVEGNTWREPALILLEAECNVDWGKDSTEKQTQEMRELATLSATYLQDAYIPPTPEEPEAEYYDPTIVPKHIPLFEPTHDHSEVLLNSLALLNQIVSKTGSQTPALPTYTGYAPQTQAYGQSYPIYNPMTYTPQPPVPQPAPVTAPTIPNAEATRMLLDLLQQQQGAQQQQQPQQTPFAMMYGFGQYQAPTQTPQQQPSQTPNYGNTYGYYYQNPQ
ncbi:hypothetical protein BGZ93_007702 [Podila epicladia]|nr:hypothetical protein BGZ93_007702 [Podila epicladia]